MPLPPTRRPAVAGLTAIVKAEPDAADDVFLVAQDDKGTFIG
jgi:hypothetical protein